MSVTHKLSSMPDHNLRQRRAPRLFSLPHGTRTIPGSRLVPGEDSLPHPEGVRPASTCMRTRTTADRFEVSGWQRSQSD